MSENKIEKIEHVPLSLVDEPLHAMRSDVWVESLEELIASIKQVGLLEPIIVRKRAGRCEVIAGHRRLAAFRKMGRPVIPAIVREVDDAEADAMKIHENLYRDNINPVDQAVFYAEYIKRTGKTFAEVAAIASRSEAWVRARVEMMSWPEYLLKYVYDRKIPVSTARWLAQIDREPLREDYCRIASLQGVNERAAKRWLEYSKMNRLPEDPAEAPADAGPAPSREEFNLVRCAYCFAKDNIARTVPVFVHPDCEVEYEKEFEKVVQIPKKEN